MMLSITSYCVSLQLVHIAVFPLVARLFRIFFDISLAEVHNTKCRPLPIQLDSFGWRSSQPWQIKRIHWPNSVKIRQKQLTECPVFTRLWWFIVSFITIASSTVIRNLYLETGVPALRAFPYVLCLPFHHLLKYSSVDGASHTLVVDNER